MEKDFSTDSTTCQPNSFIPCRECRTGIHFVDGSIVSKSGKKVPLGKDGKPQRCQNQQRYRMPSICNKISNDYNSNKQLAASLSEGRNEK